MQSQPRQWTAALVVIGDEILSGRTQDKNVAQVATWLNDQGVRLAEVRVVPDDPQRIAEAVNALRVKHDYLFTTGGIGPTTTTSRSIRSPRRSACWWSSIPRRGGSSKIITRLAGSSLPKPGCGWRVCLRAPS